jgi:hypothetical protein
VCFIRGFLYSGVGDLKKLNHKLGGLLLAEVPITVTPSPPPGVGDVVNKLLTWAMYIGWIAVAAAFILGAIEFTRGNSENGKKYVTGAIIGAIILAFYTAIITGLIG